MGENPDLDSIRARSFGAVAARYDAYRPHYPDQMVDDVVAMLPGRRVLEVGAGTGIATAAFVTRGIALTCVEPDPRMAAVLSAKLAGNADAHVDVGTFEDWSAARPAGAPGFDGLISAQAWHWTDPATRWAHAGAAVRSGGVIALFWNQEGYADPRVADTFAAVYDRRGIAMRPVCGQSAPDPNRIVDDERPDAWPEVDAEADTYCAQLRVRHYRWTHRMPVVDYVARLDTMSAHLILPPEVREDLTAELIAALSVHGDGIDLAMTTDLATAVRR